MILRKTDKKDNYYIMEYCNIYRYYTCNRSNALQIAL